MMEAELKNYSDRRNDRVSSGSAATKEQKAPYHFAKMLNAAGISCFPLRIDGSKAPSLEEWETYETRLPTPDEIEGWFGLKDSGYPQRGIACVTGEVSGNLEAIDIDRDSLIPEYLTLVEEHAPGLLSRLILIDTPKPGLHIAYRCSVIDGNQKLARVEEPATD